MAKQFPDVKVTVTIDDGKLTAHYSGGQASISGDGRGNHHVSVDGARFERTERSKPFTVSNSERKWLSEQDIATGSMLDNVVAKAKAVEGQALMSARAVELALFDELAKNAEQAHQFNMAVLAYLHAGGTQEEAVTKLQELNIGYPNEVEYIADLDVEKLYHVSAETVSV